MSQIAEATANSVASIDLAGLMATEEIQCAARTYLRDHSDAEPQVVIMRDGDTVYFFDANLVAPGMGVVGQTDEGKQILRPTFDGIISHPHAVVVMFNAGG